MEWLYMFDFQILITISNSSGHHIVFPIKPKRHEIKQLTNSNSNTVGSTATVKKKQIRRPLSFTLYIRP